MVPSVVHKGTKSKLRPDADATGEGGRAVNLFEGIFITAIGGRGRGTDRRGRGRRCHRERERERFVPARAVLRLAQLLAP